MMTCQRPLYMKSSLVISPDPQNSISWVLKTNIASTVVEHMNELNRNLIDFRITGLEMYKKSDL